jgi:hypothetical protein
VVAFTDHCIMLPHPELNDDSFLALTGYENEQLINQKEPVPRRKDCHVCYIALKKDNVTMPYYSPKSIWGNGKLYKEQVKFNFDNTLEKWGYNADITNQCMKLAREQGFFVTYNHPAWSAEHYEDYSKYTGMHAMEIFNYGSWVEGYQEYVPHIYDEFLRKGERIYAIATDDNHSENDECGGYVMVKAPKLEYADVIDALEAGNFYASNGAEIKSLWFEDGQIHVECAPAARIVYSCGVRHNSAVNCPEGTLTEATFKVDPTDKFVRITVYTKDGKFAHTNAYFTDELFCEG